MKNTAFTMLELVVVIIIIGILSVVVLPKIPAIMSSSGRHAAQMEMVEIQKAIMGSGDFRGYVSDVGSFPATLDLLVAGQSGYNPFFETGRRGDYLSEADIDDGGAGDPDVLEDPWGTLYQWDNVNHIITSYGPDKASGGGDDITLDVDG